MEFEFDTVRQDYLRRAAVPPGEQEQSLEVRLPEGFPDIGRVLWTGGQVILRGKEWRSDAVEVSAGVQAWVLYAPEDGSGIRSVDCWIPFRFSWDIEARRQEGILQVTPLLRLLDSRPVSARRLLLRAAVTVLPQVLLPEQGTFPQPGELPSEVELLNQVYPLLLETAAGERAFSVEESVVLSGPPPEKLLSVSFRPELTESRVSGTRLILRGRGTVRMLLRGSEGRVYSQERMLDFSQLGELDRVWDEGTQARVRLAVTSLEAELDGDVRLKCGLVAQYVLRQRVMLALPEDAYSTWGNVTPEFGSLTLPVALDDRREALSPAAFFDLPGAEAVEAVFLPEVPEQRRRGDRAELTLPGQLRVLYYTPEGVLDTVGARWEGELMLDVQADARVLVQPACVGRLNVLREDGGLRVEGEAAAEISVMAEQSWKPVTGISMEPAGERDPQRPSLILRPAGRERLWDIAKAAGSTVRAIRSANGLEEPVDPERILLIPIP